MVQTLQNHEQVYTKIREGIALLKDGDATTAEKCILDAWGMIPEPKYDWDCSLIIVRKISTFFRDIKKFDAATQWANDIFKCNIPPGYSKPYIILGSIYLESGDLAAARSNFQKAFDLSGKRGFEGEDPKYLKFLKNQA